MELGLLSLLPPLVAICLAIALRQVVAPLLLAILSGSIILSLKVDGFGAQVVATIASFVTFICNSVTDHDHVRALVFSLALGAMVGVLEAGGGMAALVNRFAARVKTRRGGQTLIAALGLGIFFDDYANTLLIGGTMRTTADRFGISRAKLAYLVDSTSAPVAGLSPISTWVVTEVSYVTAGLAAAAITDVSAFALLIASLPFRFYPILALVMVFAVSMTDRDFGPMADQQPQPPDSDKSTAASTQPSYFGLAAVVPIAGCVIAVLASLVWSGWQGAGSIDHLVQWLGAILSSGDSYGALIHGGVVGLSLALVMHRWLGNLSWQLLFGGAFQGAKQIIPAMVILWLAWALSAQTDTEQLNTGGYIASCLGDRVPPVLLPTAVFLVSAAVAFSTGTSWGTMAILTPISMHLAIQISGGQPYDAIAMGTLGAVLAGAIFGDHCSPISDTTVLSARASGCDHITHVRTQLPYALVVGGISILCGTLPVAYGVSPYLCLLIGAGVTVAVVFALGKKPRQFQ